MKRFMNKKRQKTDSRIKKIITHSLWILIIISFVSSCSTTKKNTIKTKELSASYIINEVKENQFDFDRMEAKIGVKVKGNKNLNLKGQMRMDRDSVIWVSLSLKVGVEVARIMITEDSLKFMNRTSRTYITEGIDKIKEILPVEASIKLIQDILVGNIPYIQTDENYNVTNDGNIYQLQSDPNNIVRKDICITANTFKITKFGLEYGLNNKGVYCQYDNFQNFNGMLLPTRIILGLDSGLMDIEIDYSNVTIGGELDYPFNITKKYSRVQRW